VVSWGQIEYFSAKREDLLQVFENPEPLESHLQSATKIAQAFRSIRVSFWNKSECFSVEHNSVLQVSQILKLLESPL
jgi:hypothetical protein